MTNSINPKTFVPRSLEVSKQQQLAKDQPDLQAEQTAQELKKKRAKRQQKVNQTSKTEANKITDEEKEESDQQQSKIETSSDQSATNQSQGAYIDVKV
ncbi:hypothetical protein [Halanaerobaculum tunisiense]